MCCAFSQSLPKGFLFLMRGCRYRFSAQMPVILVENSREFYQVFQTNVNKVFSIRSLPLPFTSTQFMLDNHLLNLEATQPTVLSVEKASLNKLRMSLCKKMVGLYRKINHDGFRQLPSRLIIHNNPHIPPHITHVKFELRT